MLIAEEAFYKIVQDTWISTLGLQIDRSAAEPVETEAITVCVKITGAWEGEVRLRCPHALARCIAAAIFQLEADGMGASEILDALSEIIHIIGGNLKALLPQPVTLSLPTLPNPGSRTPATPPSHAIGHLALTSEGHPFVVTLLEEYSTTPGMEPSADGTRTRAYGNAPAT